MIVFKSQRSNLKVLATAIVFLTWPGMCVRILQWFRCVKVGDRYYLTEDFRVKCFEGWWLKFYLPLNLVFGVAAWIVVFPWLIFRQLRRVKKSGATHTASG